MPPHRYVEEISSAVMLPAKRRSAAVALDVNFRKHVTYMPMPSVNKAVHSGFETQKRQNVLQKVF